MVSKRALKVSLQPGQQNMVFTNFLCGGYPLYVNYPLSKGSMAMHPLTLIVLADE